MSMNHVFFPVSATPSSALTTGTPPSGTTIRLGTGTPPGRAPARVGAMTPGMAHISPKSSKTDSPVTPLNISPKTSGMPSIGFKKVYSVYIMLGKLYRLILMDN